MAIGFSQQSLLCYTYLHLLMVKSCSGDKCKCVAQLPDTTSVFILGQCFWPDARFKLLCSN